MSDFVWPSTPADGDQTTGPYGEVYEFDGVKWSLVPGGTGGGGASVEVGDTPPASPSAGNLWFDTVESQLYIFDTDQDQWIIAVNPGAGPPGPAGPLGPAGPEGPAGPAGPSGPNTMPPGVTDGSNAAAGAVGEYVIGSGTVVPDLSGNQIISSTVLTPGDWDVCGYCSMNLNQTTPLTSLPGGFIQWSILTVPGMPDNMNVRTTPYVAANTINNITALLANCLLGPLRVSSASSITVTTRISLNALDAAVTAGAASSVTGGIRARRVR